MGSMTPVKAKVHLQLPNPGRVPQKCPHGVDTMQSSSRTNCSGKRGGFDFNGYLLNIIKTKTDWNYSKPGSSTTGQN